MRKIEKRIRSFLDRCSGPCWATNKEIFRDCGHYVDSLSDLKDKVDEIRRLNGDMFCLYRGQGEDYKTSTTKSSLLKATMFRNEKNKIPDEKMMQKWYDDLDCAEQLLRKKWTLKKLDNADFVENCQIARWAILQHYEVCKTPLLDVTSCLRIAASFASNDCHSEQAYLFVFGSPTPDKPVTRFCEINLQVADLTKICPCEAKRPHIQKAYSLAVYPKGKSKTKIRHRIYEADFRKHLIAKFRFNPDRFWSNSDCDRLCQDTLCPPKQTDPLVCIAKSIEAAINGNAGMGNCSGHASEDS